MFDQVCVFQVILCDRREFGVLLHCLSSATPVAEETCLHCRQMRGITVHKILFRLNMSRAPHGVAPESTLCPCCDPLWSTTGERPLPLPAVAPAGPGNNYQRTASTVSVAAAVTVSSESDYAAALAGKKKKPSASSAVHGAGAASTFNRGAGSSMVSSAAAVEESPLCGCNIASKQLTVSKEGPNKGRKFYSCVKSRYVSHNDAN